jgi:hypothetical protein
MRFHLRLISAGLLMSVLVLGGSANAAPTKSSVAAHAGVGKIIKELHLTHKLLEEADHDYDGHRAKAAHEVHEAIHALMAHTGNGETKPAEKVAPKPAEKPAKPAGGAGLKESQAVSDAQLKEALANLQKIEAHFGSVKSEKSEHIIKAEKNVTAAIGELKIALSIK